MTTLLDRPATPELDAITLLPGRAALLDVLALRRSVGAGLVLVGLPCPGTVPLGAAVLVDVTAALSGALVDGEWLARCGPAEFAVVTDEPPTTAAARLVAVLDLPVATGSCPVTADRTAADVLRVATRDLADARRG